MLPKDARALLKIEEDALNSLTLQQQQVSFVLGHSLRSLYEDVLRAPVPEYLQALAAQPDHKTRVEAQARDEMGSELQHQP